MITSGKQSTWQDDIIITDLIKAGLTATSKIRLKVFSLDSKLIIDKLGELIDQDKEALNNVIKKYL